MPPPRPVTHADLVRQAIRLIEAGQVKQADRVLKSVLKDEPDNFDALLAMGVLSGQRNDLAAAVRHLARAVRRRPQSGEALYNLGQALISSGRHAEAADALARAVPNADLPHVHEKLGDCYVKLDRLPDAIRHYQRAVDLTGVSAGGMLLSSWVEAKRRACDWNQIADAEAQLVRAAAKADPVEPLLLNYVTDDPELLLRNASAYASGFLPAHVPPPLARPRFVHSRRERPRIRIGYLCSDFRTHATSHLAVDLFERHDRKRFECFALSFGPDDASPLRRRVQNAFEHFVDLSRATSQEIANRIHTLGIDVLVDLNGYIAKSRPEILMARPAPVQCHYLAYPGTLGSTALDYLIVDPVVAPPQDHSYYTENLVSLPDCYQPNDAGRAIAAERPSRMACGLPQAGVVLASFNNPIKLAPEMFAIWMRVLEAVPGTVLWLFADNPAARQQLIAEGGKAGFGPNRIVIAEPVPPAEHLARLLHADLLLDSFPYGAHTTASDALWMGVPVLTLSGRSFASRVCASLLRAVELPDLITATPKAYEEAAMALARDSARLVALKEHLVAGRDRFPLFDTARLARHLEAAFAEMWRRWVAGEQAGPIDAAALAADKP